MPPRPLARTIALYLRVIGMLKYGIAFSVLVIYVPLTTFEGVPLHGMLGNLFSELSPSSALVAAVFVFLVAWTVMIVIGLIVNGVEIRFPRSTPARGYRTFAEIRQDTPDRLLPPWVDALFSVPVTLGQFVLFTGLLAGPACVVMILHARAGEWIGVLVAVVIAFVAAYGLLIFAAAPAAILDPADPPLRDSWPGTTRFWPWLGRTPFRAFAESARWVSSFAARTLHMDYILDRNDPPTIYPAHLLATMALVGFVALWLATGRWLDPTDRTAPSVVYLYVGLLMLLWIFGGLSFHLGRVHISPLVPIALFIGIGYVMDVDHRFRPAKPPTTAEISIDPIDVAAAAQDNLVVVATAGGGVWAAGWTARALEQLTANRPQLLREIRVISGVSGGSVGAAYVIDGMLRAGPGASPASILHDARVRSTASSLEPVAYGFSFLDIPRLLSGGIYDPERDRGQLLEDEWARIAAAPIQDDTVGRRPQSGLGRRRLRSLNTSIRDGVIPAPIFGATAMEAGQRVMITPITFASPEARARTLQEFVLNTVASTPEPDVDLWTAARLSATFTYISPPARSWLDAAPAQRQHLIDGGYYDNYGVTAALDWLTPVLWAKKHHDARLSRVKRVLIVELSAFAEPAETATPARGITAALFGPLTVFFTLREGVATSRNRIDLARFKDTWNELLHGELQIASVKFEPQASHEPGPLSWHLSSREISRLNRAWGTSADPQSWPANLREEWATADRFLRGGGS
jgi:Patatin-like phospholipase